MGQNREWGAYTEKPSEHTRGPHQTIGSSKIEVWALTQRWTLTRDTTAPAMPF